MRDPIILLVHLIATLARLMGPGGLRSVVAESLLVKQQLLMLNRSRHRAPNLCASDRILAGVCALFMRPARVFRSAIVLRPSTILNFHRTLRQRKYRLLFSPKRRRTGPKGPPKDLVDAIVDMKRRNPRWGWPRIATTDRARLCGRQRQGRGAPSARYARSTGTPLGWSVLADVPGACEGSPVEHRPVPVRVGDPAKPLGAGSDGPIHAADRRLWHPCWNRGWPGPVPYVQPCDSRALASDAPQLRPRPAVSVSPMACANLRVLQVTEVKSVPYVPLSHPFVERLIGTRCDENAWISCCSGRRRTWKTNWWPSRTSTMRIGPMRRWTGGRPSRYERMSHGSTATDGTRIAVVSIRRRSRRDI